jgi:hypothetical protein
MSDFNKGAYSVHVEILCVYMHILNSDNLFLI